MDTIFLNSDNSKTFTIHLLYIEKHKKNHTKIINLKYQL